MNTFDPENPPSLGEEIRDLRHLRRLSLSGAAVRARMTPGALGNWETGRRVPRGAPLKRLLAALEAPPRLRARLLALADPAYARIELASDPLGAPVHLGEVLRALRRKAGLSQEALARRVGASQSAVARWESGDDVPDAMSLHAALFAVGAVADQIEALTRLVAQAPPRDLFARIDAINNAPHALVEPLLLSFKRDLWWRATQDASAQSLLVLALARHAQWCEMDGRPDEVAPLAQRAIRLCAGGPDRVWATPGFLTLAQVRLWRGEDPLRVARETGDWAEGLGHMGAKAWAQSTRALALAATGDPSAVGIARRALGLAGEHYSGEVVFRQIDLAEVHLALGEPDLAVEALGPDFVAFVYGGLAFGRPPWGLPTRARAFAAAGARPEPELLPTLRNFVAQARVPRYARELRSVERLLARSEARDRAA